MNSKLVGVNSKRFTATVTGGFLLVLIASSLAWACSVQPRFFSITPAGAVAGENVLVRGQQVLPGTAIVIVWNALEGEKLGETAADDQGNFSVLVKIPEATPDIYALIAKAGDSGVARMAFEVIGGSPDSQPGIGAVRAAASAQSDLWEGFAGGSRPTVSTTGDPSTSQPGLSAGLGLGLGLGALGAGGLLMAVITAGRRRRA